MGDRPYTSERAWRVSVLPLGVLLVAVGLIGLVGAFVLPVGFVPFVRHTAHRRVAVAALGAVSAGLGIGLLLRWRVAWYALFAYLALGMIWATAGVLWDHHFHVVDDIRWFLVCLNLVMGSVLIGGIYVMTRAVFRSPRRSKT